MLRVALLTLSLTLIAPLLAQADPPDAKKTVARAVAAHGGLKAWRDAEAITYTLRVRRPDEPPKLLSIGYPTSGSHRIEGVVAGKLMTYTLRADGTRGDLVKQVDLIDARVGRLWRQWL